jgi:hypothetical protein
MTLKLAIAGKKRVGIEAFEKVGDFIAVHQEYLTEKTGFKPDWRVSHCATGYGIRVGFPTKRSALKFARKIVHLDWSGKTVKAVCRKVSGDILRLIEENPL